MFYIFIILAVLIAIALGVVAALMAARASELARKLQTIQTEADALQSQILTWKGQNHSLKAVNQDLASRLDQAQAVTQEMSSKLVLATDEEQKKVGWLDHQQQEIAWLRAELEKRPKVTRKTYKILTLGVKWTGKTSLTLKWANPLIDLGSVQGTKIERYERTVSQVVLKDVTTEHVFEIGDWGGEHIVDAQQEMIVDEIHGMLIVVDLGGKDARAVDPARIQEQLREFQPESLKYFFGPKTVASCKAVVLFINKSDLLPGSPAETEAQAKHLYGRLIDNLLKFQTQVDIRVFVGSANYGHSTHMLFSHFVEKILPKNAYDNQLLQRMKAENGPAGARNAPAKLPAPPARV